MNLLTEMVNGFKYQTNHVGSNSWFENISFHSDPLFIYTKNGDALKVQRLLVNGADPNIRHPLGWSPIHIAAIQANPEIVKLLLKVSARIISLIIFLIKNIY